MSVAKKSITKSVKPKADPPVKTVKAQSVRGVKVKVKWTRNKMAEMIHHLMNAETLLGVMKIKLSKAEPLSYWDQTYKNQCPAAIQAIQELRSQISNVYRGGV